MGKQFVLLGVLLMIGGCVMREKHEFTKEIQQDMVQGIVQGYQPQTIRFLNYQWDEQTGFYYVQVALDEHVTILTLNSLDRAQVSGQLYALSPKETFDRLKRDPNAEMMMPKVEYLEEK